MQTTTTHRRNPTLVLALGILATTTLCLGSYSQAQATPQSLSSSINNQPVKEKSLLYQGKAYVPAEMLKNLGIAVRLSDENLDISNKGGASQSQKLEGCLGQKLLNGMFTIQINNITSYERGYEINLTYGNATNDFADMLQYANSPFLVMVLKDGTQIIANHNSYYYKLHGRLLANSTQTKTIPFDLKNKRMAVTPSNPPAKVLIFFRQKRGTNYTVPDPNMLFDLTCRR